MTRKSEVSERQALGLGSSGYLHKVRAPHCPTLLMWLRGPGPGPGGFSGGAPWGRNG